MNWGATFLNRFDFKVRKAGRLTRPDTGEEFEVDPSIQARSFKRVFGEVVQFPFSAGILKRARFHLTAIHLAAARPLTAGENTPSAGDLLQEITGPSGLDLPDDSFHCIGIFSSAGWPEERKKQVEIRGDTLWYLVQKEEGTRWSVFGPEGPWRQFFDPEIPEEKMARARDALHSHPRLILPGDAVATDVFLKEHDLDGAILTLAVQASGGLFEIVEHKGQSYIQRRFR